MQSRPAVSVVIPVYNRPRLLLETLDSIANQTMDSWEAVIVDDGSTDETVAVARERAESEPRFRVLERTSPQRGANVCRNLGAKEARANLLIFLDSDDLLAPHALAGRVQMMERMPELDCCGFYGEAFNNTPGDLGVLVNVGLGGGEFERLLSFDFVLNTPTMIWTRRAFELTGGWNEKSPMLHDWELSLRALASGVRYLMLAEIDWYYRVGEHPHISNAEYASIEHLDAGLTMGIDLCRFFKSKNAFTDQRRRLCAGILLLLAYKYMAEHPDPQRLEKVRDLCVELELLPADSAREIFGVLRPGLLNRGPLRLLRLKRVADKFGLFVKDRYFMRFKAALHPY